MGGEIETDAELDFGVLAKLGIGVDGILGASAGVRGGLALNGKGTGKGNMAVKLENKSAKVLYDAAGGDAGEFAPPNFDLDFSGDLKGKLSVIGDVNLIFYNGRLFEVDIKEWTLGGFNGGIKLKRLPSGRWEKEIKDFDAFFGKEKLKKSMPVYKKRQIDEAKTDALMGNAMELADIIEGGGESSENLLLKSGEILNSGEPRVLLLEKAQELWQQFGTLEQTLNASIDETVARAITMNESAKPSIEQYMKHKNRILKMNEMSGMLDTHYGLDHQEGDQRQVLKDKERQEREEKKRKMLKHYYMSTYEWSKGGYIKKDSGARKINKGKGVTDDLSQQFITKIFDEPQNEKFTQGLGASNSTVEYFFGMKKSGITEEMMFKHEKDRLNVYEADINYFRSAYTKLTTDLVSLQQKTQMSKDVQKILEAVPSDQATLEKGNSGAIAKIRQAFTKKSEYEALIRKTTDKLQNDTEMFQDLSHALDRIYTIAMQVEKRAEEKK